MKTKTIIISALIGLLPLPGFAQLGGTEVVGFTTTTLLGESDSAISLPFVRPAAFVGTIQSATGNTIIVNGSPWTANQLVYAPGSQPNHHYVLIGRGTPVNPKEGHTYPIVANSANTLTVELGEDDLTGIPANAQISVIPNWSLKTVFPPADQNVSYTPTTSTAAFKTQIRVPDPTAAGVNGPFTSYFFSNNAWRIVGDDAVDRGDDPLLPDSYFIVRNLNGAPTLPLVIPGSVLTKKVSTALSTSTTGQQDNPVGLLRPLDVALNATGFNNGDGSFVAGDQLLLFNNAVVGYDKAPRVYVQDPSILNGRWTLAGDPNNDRGAEVIPTAAGFVIRKAPSANGQPVSWNNNFPVQAVKVVSRKTHGAAGTFDIDLPLAGNPGVESRESGGNHKIVFTFPTLVTVNAAAVTSGTATVSSAAPLAGGTEVTVDLSDVLNGQRITVTLLGVNDGNNVNDVAVRVGFLPGDTTGPGSSGASSVNATDISQVKAQSGQPVTAANFRADVNVSGSLNSSDISLVKTKSGTLLPVP